MHPYENSNILDSLLKDLQLNGEPVGRVYATGNGISEALQMGVKHHLS